MKAKNGSTSKAGKASPQAVAPADSVDQFLKSLVHPSKAEIEVLRRVILGADRRITEGIKWNAPSFFCHEWFATFNLRAKGAVQIIFHRGAKVKPTGGARYVDDPSAVLEWITNDRCSARFMDLNDVKAKAPALKKIVAQWVKNLADEATG